MTRNRKRILLPILLIALLVVSAMTWAASAKLRGSKTAEANTSRSVANLSDDRRDTYIRRSRLSPKLVWRLSALGDRLEKTGKERLTVTGTLSWTRDSQTDGVTAVLEFPERLRLTLQQGAQPRVLIFDGEQAKSGVDPLETVERDLMETLVYGSAEHFFTTQMQGRATRFLGSRFRIDDGSTPDYTGPYYDVYKIAEPVKTSAEQGEQLKTYYFNSDTLLLERVTYELTRNGATVKVEEKLSDWTKEQGQQVARRIERFENGESVFVLTVQTASFSQFAEDGIFDN